MRLSAAVVRLTALARSESGSYFGSTFARRETLHDLAAIPHRRDDEGPERGRCQRVHAQRARVPVGLLSQAQGSRASPPGSDVRLEAVDGSRRWTDHHHRRKEPQCSSCCTRSSSRPQSPPSRRTAVTDRRGAATRRPGAFAVGRLARWPRPPRGSTARALGVPSPE